ncbi:MAG: cyclodeaminase/cyclohydrolase family protein, partial [Solirubrobacterales bacterium]
MSLEETLDRLAEATPAPGAGATAAWCCAMAAALVEMVSGVVIARGEGRPELESRRRRAAELRAVALRLADEDEA